eukprot:Clim_evm119s109 gene=Clim_evmTU119s109
MSGNTPLKSIQISGTGTARTVSGDKFIGDRQVVRSRSVSEADPALPLKSPFAPSKTPAEPTNLKVALVTAVWFLSNITISNVNKVIFKFYDFKFPIFVTIVHMVVCSIMSFLFLRVFRFGILKKVPQRIFYRSIVPLAFVFFVSVCSGNVALKYIYVSYAQMIGATTPLFTVVVSVLVTGATFNQYVWLSMVPIAGGIMLTISGEVNFNMVGTLFLILATIARALKTVLQGMLLSGKDMKMDSMNLLYYMAPATVAFLTPTCIIWEGSDLLVRFYESDDSGLWQLVLASGFTAFFVNYFNFLVTQYTSAVTQQVLGNLKVVMSIISSVVIFENEISGSAALGCLIALCGGALYGRVNKWPKHLKLGEFPEDKQLF